MKMDDAKIFAAMVQACPNPAGMLDNELRFVEFNGMMESFLGLPKGAAKGKALEGFLSTAARKKLADLGAELRKGPVMLPI